MYFLLCSYCFSKLIEFYAFKWFISLFKLVIFLICIINRQMGNTPLHMMALGECDIGFDDLLKLAVTLGANIFAENSV